MIFVWGVLILIPGKFPRQNSPDKIPPTKFPRKILPPKVPLAKISPLPQKSQPRQKSTAKNPLNKIPCPRIQICVPLMAHSAPSQSGDGEFQLLLANINRELAEVGCLIVKKPSPPETLKFQDRRQAVLDAPLIGSPCSLGHPHYRATRQPCSWTLLSARHVIKLLIARLRPLHISYRLCP
jgi:hypothetical protein